MTPLAALGQADVVPQKRELPSTIDVERSGPRRQFYELRAYRLASAEKQKPLEEYLAQAAIPAWNRVGVKPVGAFKEMDGASPDVYVVLPYDSPGAIVAVNSRLMANQQYVKAGRNVLDAPKDDPAFVRVESSLLLAFEAMPRLEVPTQAPTRIIQLRIYESHNATKAKKKIEMFGAGGEIDIFRRVGLAPVLFGETLVGSKIPNLTYILSFESKEAMERNWEAFRQDPAWLKIKDDPQYKDTVSNITNLVLVPLACSQI
jgi:hypothetical protein